MFYGCSSLVTGPELPAMELKYNCYSYMFYKCSSLVTAPELPANYITVANVYESMFYDCRSLVKAPELPSTKVTSHCYSQMFLNLQTTAIP